MAFAHSLEPVALQSIRRSVSNAGDCGTVSLSLRQREMQLRFCLKSGV